MAYDGTVKISTDLDASGAEKGLKNLGKVIASSAIVTAIGSIGKAIVSSYADYEQLVGGVDTLFKASSAKLQEYAASAYKTAGLSANAYMETVTSFSASLIQSLGGDTKMAVAYADGAVTDMADNANKFGTAMESVQFAYQGFAKQNFTMLDNLKLGYGGTKTEMERLLVDAEKLSGLEFDISSFADITQAIHVIQDSMGVAGATAAEAEHTISGSINALKGAWANLLTGLGDANADVSKLAGNVVKQFNTVAKNVLPVLDRLTDSIPVIKQLKAMLPIIVGVGAAFAAWKVSKVLTSVAAGFQFASLQVRLYSMSVGGAITADALQTTGLTAKEIVVGVLTGKIGLATAAQYVWNAAMAANPLGLVLVAATALIGGIIVLSTVLSQETEEEKRLREELEASKTAREELNASIEETKDAYSDSSASIRNQAQTASDLLAKIRELSTASTDNETAQYQLKTAVEQLQAVMPDLGISYDNTNKKVLGLTDSTESYLASLAKVQQAEQDRDTGLKLLQDLKTATDERIAAEKRLQDLGGYNDGTYGDYSRLRQAEADVASWIETENEAIAAAAEFDAAMVSNAENAALAAEEIADEEQKQKIIELAEAYGVGKESIEAFVASGGTLEDWAARQDAAIASAEESLNRLVEAYYNMNEQIKASDDQSLAARNANIEANQAAVNAYASNLDAIAAQAGEKGIEINSRLWQELQAGTPESMDLANDILASMELGDGQWEQLNANFSAGLEGALGTVSQNMTFADGANPAQAIIDEMVITLTEDSTVETASEGVVEDALSAARSRVAGLDFSQIGTNMMKGIENGIRNGTAGIVAAINSAIAQAHAAAQSIDEQHSPSQWWEKFGLNDMKGFALGIDGGAAIVQRAQTEMVRNLQRQMAPVYASEGINPGYGSVVNNYTQNLYTHDSLSPHEQMQEFSAFKAREGWTLP